MKAIFGFVILVSSPSFGEALIDPALKGFALTQTVRRSEKVLALVQPLSHTFQMPRPQRYSTQRVINYYQAAARSSAQPLIDSMRKNELPGVKILNIFWINGSVLADVTPEGLKLLANHPSVTKIYKNARVDFDRPLARRMGRFGFSDGEKKLEYDFTMLGLDKLFKERPDINGQGVTVGVVDTGVDASHPALQGKVSAYYNGDTSSETPPRDFDTHGTHVSGTIVGGDRQGNWIGMAPGARIVMAGVVASGYDAILAGMQWMLDIEKNPQHPTKVKLANCSWTSRDAPDQELFYRAVSTWEAAGILPVFSAGNSGTQGLTPPHEHPATLTVGAYDENGRVGRFSSRGPGHYKGQLTQKPDISAPGVNINSSIPGGGYERMDGTSMATPHVSGTIALMLQVNPQLNPAQIRLLLRQTSLPADGMSAGQWSPEYGFGKMDSYGAVQAALNAIGQVFLSSLMPGTFLFEDSLATMDAKVFKAASLGEVGGVSDQFSGTDKAQWLDVRNL